MLRRFETDDEIKGMMDILFAKGLGLVKKKKDQELDKFLKPKKADMVWLIIFNAFIIFIIKGKNLLFFVMLLGSYNLLLI